MEAIEDLLRDVGKLIGIATEGEALTIEDLKNEARLAKMQLDDRLLPEGYTWPRYEDGIPVQAHDIIYNPSGCKDYVPAVIFTDEGGFILDSFTWETAAHKPYEPGECRKYDDTQGKIDRDYSDLRCKIDAVRAEALECNIDPADVLQVIRDVEDLLKRQREINEVLVDD